MGGSSAPEQATTKTNLGLFGSATTGKGGTTYNPTTWTNTFGTGLQNLASDNLNRVANREVSAEAVDNLNRQFMNDYNNTYLRNALAKNLLRGSSASDMMATAANNYANDRYNLINQEMANNMNYMNNALNAYNMLYNQAAGLAGLSQGDNQATNNYQLNAFKASDNSPLWSQLANTGAQVAGTAAKAFLL